MSGPGAKARSASTPVSASLRNLVPWKPGQSGNPEGRRAEIAKRERELGPVDTANRDTIQLTAVLRRRVDAGELADLLIGLCREGNLRAIAYVYDRLEGLPVQRHEAKLQTEVDNTARILAERYGLSVEEVQARARAIASGT